uniref:NADH-ubiquinone oxidoreductase chain 4L n=1 Tax=Prionopetalum kraepelini TaxID=2931675 RepID=A0A8T9JBP1_9MYRI|nr:NADH dehydrogenase subunit 4L [Prionopetalum kraepelini]UOF70476.1 NADH dehydrogenase subunit 4L [Prionopetalum kraepelini]
MIMLVLIISGFITFVLMHKHTLNMLLSLEFIMLSLVVGLSMLLNNLESESYFILYFLTFAACEGALGLSIIVAMIRSHGSDFFWTFNVTQC